MFDLSSSTATDAMVALSTGSISSVELLDAMVQRVERFNPTLNAVVALDVDRARVRAQAADEARARGETWGRLHGLPMTIKDIFATEGLVTTSGHVPFANYVPDTDASAVAALKRAGAIVFAKTNLPEFGGDIQSYNAIHGVCRNPWNPERTSGGSSGGAAVALATGMSVLELGSDIGGSIRVPCHYNGVYGHKSTYGAIDEFGEIPLPSGWTHAPVDLVVTGPMGRSVADLSLGLDVLTGAGVGGVPGAALPPASPRALSARGLRVGVWVDDPAAPTSTEIKAAIRAVANLMADYGAIVTETAGPGPSLDEQNLLYQQLLSAAVLSPRSLAATHRDWMAADERRHRLIAAYQRFFTGVDVVLAPIAPTTAFTHRTEGPLNERTLTVDGVTVPYLRHLAWAGLATLPGLPSTAVPIGRSAEGLPIGMQIIGPKWGDRTTIAVAGMVESLIGGFVPPPGYGSASAS